MRTAGWAGSTRAARLPADWRRTRQRIMRRDQGVCHVCGQPGADQVDHIVAGDDHSDSNLAAIHAAPCHQRKTISERRRPGPTQWRRPVEQHPGLLRPQGG